MHRFGKELVKGFPFMEEEVEYACKHEMAVTVKDMLSNLNPNPYPYPNPNPYPNPYPDPNPNPNPNPNPYQVKDMLSLRMRLAYINSEAAKKAHSKHAQP